MATGWSIKTFVATSRRSRTTYLKVGNQTLPAQEPLPSDLAGGLFGRRSPPRCLAAAQPGAPRLSGDVVGQGCDCRGVG